MNESTLHGISRREFLAGTSMLGAATLLGLPRTAAAEPPPEITKIRLVHTPVICFAPQYLAEELLRLEGFTEVEYIKPGNNGSTGLMGAGAADLVNTGPTAILPALDEGTPITVLAGLHFGCWELFANDSIKSIRDLKGKAVAITGLGNLDHVWIASMMSYVGMDPRKDVRWIPTQTIAESMRLFLEGKADAFLAFPPQPQELRAKKIGRVIVNITLDRPWSQYFCCMLAARREFVRDNPIATKRAMRALLKATDICSRDPELAARFLVTKGYEPRYEIALEVLKSLPYDRWRQANPEDTLRFHAVRLHEVGMIKTSPQKLIAQGTDWRILNELKKELKA